MKIKKRRPLTSAHVALLKRLSNGWTAWEDAGYIGKCYILGPNGEHENMARITYTAMERRGYMSTRRTPGHPAVRREWRITPRGRRTVKAI